MTDAPALMPPPARTWRARAADAAAADVGRGDEPTAIAAARRLVDRGLTGGILALAALAVLGVVAGWTTTAELLRPVDVPVHAPALLLIVVGTPWLLLLVRAVAVLLLRRQGLPILGRLVPASLGRAVGRHRPAGIDDALASATARRVGAVLANGSGRRVAAAGSGVFWTAFAAASLLTIWLLTARVALGFGWESSWLSPRVGQVIADLAAAPLAPVIGTEELRPVAAPPSAPADDPVALEARRGWIRFLTTGIAIYLLIPMLAWTLANAAIGHWLAERWRAGTGGPAVSTRPAAPTSAMTSTASEVIADVVEPPSSTTVGCSHLVRLEWGDAGSPLPPTLDRLIDLGDLDTETAVRSATATLASPDSRVAVLAWLPSTPDRGVRRRLAELRRGAARSPVLVLDGGEALRRRETEATASLRLGDWRGLARELDLTAIEVDLSHLTTETRRRLASFVDGDAAAPDNAAAPIARLDPRRLDAALAAIGRGLDGDDPLPGDAAHVRVAREIAACFETDAPGGDRAPRWTTSIRRLGEIDADDVRGRLAALSAAGLDLVPARLRAGAVWSALGGVLGATACIAAASVVPAALVALPGWAGTGAGIGGLLSLARRTSGRDVDEVASEFATRPLDAGVPALATFAVLLWSQGGDESRTTRLLKAVLPDDRLPDLADADAARHWIAAMRGRVVTASEATS